MPSLHHFRRHDAPSTEYNPGYTINGQTLSYVENLTENLFNLFDLSHPSVLLHPPPPSSSSPAATSSLHVFVPPSLLVFGHRLSARRNAVEVETPARPPPPRLSPTTAATSKAVRSPRGAESDAIGRSTSQSVFCRLFSEIASSDAKF